MVETCKRIHLFGWFHVVAACRCHRSEHTECAHYIAECVSFRSSTTEETAHHILSDRCTHFSLHQLGNNGFQSKYHRNDQFEFHSIFPFSANNLLFFFCSFQNYHKVWLIHFALNVHEVHLQFTLEVSRHSASSWCPEFPTNMAVYTPTDAVKFKILSPVRDAKLLRRCVRDGAGW